MRNVGIDQIRKWVLDEIFDICFLFDGDGEESDRARMMEEIMGAVGVYKRIEEKIENDEPDMRAAADAGCCMGSVGAVPEKDHVEMDRFVLDHPDGQKPDRPAEPVRFRLIDIECEEQYMCMNCGRAFKIDYHETIDRWKYCPTCGVEIQKFKK